MITSEPHRPGTPPGPGTRAGGRAHRRRRLIAGMAGVFAVVAAAALVVTALLPASHQAGQQPRAQLTVLADSPDMPPPSDGH